MWGAIAGMAGKVLGGSGGGDGGKGGGGGLISGIMKQGKSGAASGISMATGLAQMIAGAAQKKKAEKLFPGMEDPEDRAELERIKQDMKGMSSGTDATTAANLREINQGTLNTQRAIGRNVGGSVGGAISGMLQAQRTGASQANQVFGEARKNMGYFQNMRNQMQQRISQRKLELGMQRYQQKMAEATNNQQSGFGNLMQGVMQGMGAQNMAPKTGSASVPQADMSSLNTATPSYQDTEVNTQNIPDYNSRFTGSEFSQKPF